MPYALGRTFNDADSHLMELSDWLTRYADPGVRERLRPLHLGGAGALAREAVEQAEARRGDPEAARALEERLMKAKGWHALGAFDPFGDGLDLGYFIGTCHQATLLASVPPDPP